MARFKDPQLRSDAQALQGAVAELVRIYQFRDRDRICCHDISVTQCHALEVLAERGPLRSQALAEILRLEKSTVTRVVDALVRKGYAERLTDPDDARALQLRITREGQALHQRINEDLVEQHASLLGDLEPALRARVAEIVRALARAAEARFVPGAGAAVCRVSACGPTD